MCLFKIISYVSVLKGHFYLCFSYVLKRSLKAEGSLIHEASSYSQCAVKHQSYFLPTGTITMALLENLKPGHIYFVKVSASNNMGDGPFSHTVELTVRADLSSGHDPRLSRGSTHSTGHLICYDWGLPVIVYAF